MKTKKRTLFLLIFSILLPIPCLASGFTADWVNIERSNSGRYRVTVKYTNLEIGQYREAYIDFTSKKEAIDVFQKLAKGATFYWGDSKKIFFEKEVTKKVPY